MARAQQRLGLPDGFKVNSAFPFKGINQSASRTAMDDAEFYWLENYIRVGDGNLRTLWDAGPAFYTSPTGTTIVYPFFYSIGQNDYVAIFLSDGTAVQVSYPSGTETAISTTPGLFYDATTGQRPVASQSGTQYLLIANNNTQNDYWIWDGSTLYGAGGIAPIGGAAITDGGSGYTSVPTYTVFGGSGSGVVLTPIISEGSVIGLTVDNTGTGYLPGDVVQVAFSGGGSDTTPIITATVTAGNIVALTLIAGGSGYPSGTFPLSFSGGGGTGATGTFTSSGGVVTAVALTNGGSSYTGTPTISFPIPGSGAAITAVESGGAVTSLSITSGGSGYVTGTYALSFAGSGTGASATYTVNASGVVASTTILAGGTGYATAPTVSIPTGSGASAVPLLSQGSVTGLTIVNGGTNITGTPTVTFSGGSGIGAAATLTVSGGAVTTYSITNAGSGYTSDPAVIVETGLNNAAAATLTLMPFGVSGTTLETYQSRVWIAVPFQQGTTSNGGTFFVSAPSSLTNFATSSGGDIFTNTDRFLRKNYTILRQTSNFLYAAADSSVSVISNVQTGGSPTATTFSYQNTDPQTGTNWRDSAQDFYNTILFGNAFGAFGLYGGSVRKVSGKIDDIFTNFVPPSQGGLVPTSAVANIFNIKVYLLLLTITDPFTAKPRNVMVMWDQANWYVASQTPALVQLCFQEIASNLQAWGSDGTSLYPLFNAPSSNLVKIVSTKLWNGASAFMVQGTHSLYLDAVDKSAGQVGITFTGSIDASGIAVPAQNSVTGALASCPSGSYGFTQDLTFVATQPLGAVYTVGVGGGIPQVPGFGLGVTLASSSPDFTLRNIIMGTIELTAVA